MVNSPHNSWDTAQLRISTSTGYDSAQPGITTTSNQPLLHRPATNNSLNRLTNSRIQVNRQPGKTPNCISAAHGPITHSISSTWNYHTQFPQHMELSHIVPNSLTIRLIAVQLPMELSNIAPTQHGTIKDSTQTSRTHHLIFTIKCIQKQSQ